MYRKLLAFIRAQEISVAINNYTLARGSTPQLQVCRSTGFLLHIDLTGWSLKLSIVAVAVPAARARQPPQFDSLIPAKPFQPGGWETPVK